MEKKLKIAVIGGGSSYTPELIEGFIKKATEVPVSEIYLVDVEQGKEKLEIVGNLARRMVEKAGLDIKINLTLERKEAIDGADFVITQFRVGGIDARIRDEKIPLKYNVIGQETTGPGGFAKALRTIPVILEICKDIEELSPNAWLINFTNPSGIITETALKHSKVKALGLCNVPVNMISHVAKACGVEMERIYIQFAGLNHLVWGLRVYLDGEDITEKLMEQLTSEENMTMKNIPALEWDKDLIKSLGMLPCPYHRYYYMMDKMLEEEKRQSASEGTRGEVVKKVEQELFELYKNPELAEKPPQLERRGGALYSYAACNLISSIVNNKKDIQVVNVKNNGTILDLPENVVIETNCVIDKDGAHPLSIGRVPARIRGLMQVVKAYEELTIEAGVNGDYNAALQALTIHPLVPSTGIAKKILDNILAENRDYLPQFFK
ncbi:putative 6-phospho-beta-glucosidase [Fervidicola ferrireducens]|uniref:Putative 6-phospho-beta-glucosidase n=1 Tax=Fervidicola ferrireducens TaxID=520764 RepID=A0A140LD08_9FIRM|nr:6-phospho-beta-glucosidase [Fervidicola ferrireducens]KXG78433.1 putative 6-phospho-beta-glucosidase [Fervidicola ferrireducens]